MPNHKSRQQFYNMLMVHCHLADSLAPYHGGKYATVIITSYVKKIGLDSNCTFPSLPRNMLLLKFP